MENIKKIFTKQAKANLNGTLYKAMDVMPDIVKGNRKLERVVDHILECHRGTKNYPNVVEAIRGIVSTATTFGKDGFEMAAAKSKYMIPPEPKKVKVFDILMGART
jgi:hypothetical protein